MADREIKWFPLAVKLKDFLVEYTYSDGTPLFNNLVDRDILDISIGKGIAGVYPSINIIFGEEQTTDDEKQSVVVGGDIQLWIDICIKGEDDGTSSYDGLYRQMFNAEQEINKVLTEFNNEIKKYYKIGTKISVEGIFSDGDEQLPILLQHRIVLRIKWQK